MTHVRIKLIVAATLLAAAVVFLGFAGVREGWVYFLPVDDYVQGDYGVRRVRLHGVVGAEQLEANPGLLTARFDLLGETGRVRIEYEGIVPDTFAQGRDVVVEGCADEHGLFHADIVMTKCASKYGTEGGEAPHADPRGAEGSTS